MTLSFSARLRRPGFLLDVAFEGPGQGVTALFGPSGSGKSTVLAIAAGLIRPDESHFGVNGVVLADSEIKLFIPPERRQVGLVFQDARLFPHMSVERNLRYGWDRRRTHPITFEAVILLLGLDPLLSRRPHTLSGGEKQRVAIGRALLSQPHLLLLDEPLASLDGERKAEILPYLARLPASIGLPLLYVTHDFAEAAQLADNLVLIEDGRVQAQGKLTALSARADVPLARRADAGAVLACTLSGHDAAGLSRLECAPGVTLLVPRIDAPRGSALRVRIPAREVILAHGDTRGLEDAVSLHNILPGRVRAIVPDPDRRASLVEIDLGGAGLLARVTPDAVNRLELRDGAAVLALVKAMSVEVLRLTG